MQCKDIPEEPILRYLAGEVDGYEGWPVMGLASRNRGDDGCPDAGSILNAMPAGIPINLAMAKAYMMIRKGVIDGCTCGCRGDFEITEKGRAVIPVATSA